MFEGGTDFEHEGLSGNVISQWEGIKDAFETIIEEIKELTKDSAK